MKPKELKKYSWYHDKSTDHYFKTYGVIRIGLQFKFPYFKLEYSWRSPRYQILENEKWRSIEENKIDSFTSLKFGEDFKILKELFKPPYHGMLRKKRTKKVQTLKKLRDRKTLVFDCSTERSWARSTYKGNCPMMLYYDGLFYVGKYYNKLWWKIWRK